MTSPVHIKVEYPIVEKQVIMTLEEAKSRGYTKEIARYYPVNRPQHIYVRSTERIIKEMYMNSDDYEKELSEMCVKQTGMTPAAYQTKYGRAWNE